MDWKELFHKIISLPRSRRAPTNRQKAMAAFRRRYLSFKSLLQANADLAVILSRLTQAQLGEIDMETREARKLARKCCLLCHNMTGALNAMSGNRHAELAEVCQKICQRVENELRRHTKGDLRTIVLPLTEVDASMAYIVGGKSANLGELGNILNLRIPRGFAVTIKASTIFLLRNGDLFKKIYTHLCKVDVDRPHTLKACARAVAALIAEAPMPQALLGPVLEAWDATFAPEPGKAVAALRSSAVAEDGAQSFAGQYSSVLGVTRDTLDHAIRQVIGSLFSERALAYRASHGYPLDAMGMGLCCLEMVAALVSGVAFSRNPVDLRSNCVLVNAVRGLGEPLVDGRQTPDQWLVSRASGKIREYSSGNASTSEGLVHVNGHWRTVETPLPEGVTGHPSLDDAQAAGIAEAALAIERHYNYPQDVEWAMNSEGEIFFLQTRPLGMDCAGPDFSGVTCPNVGDVRPQLAGGDVAARGVACGKVIRLHANEELGHFPEGSVILVENSSPNLMGVLRRAGALLAENGSLTGHMASICREFGIPAIFNLPGATSILEAGSVVTVDALAGRVFAGKIEPLMELATGRPKIPANTTPAMTLLRRVGQQILPLHLVEPQSELFTARNCLSLHDVMRYAHEKSYEEMFLISDSLSESGISGVASKLVCAIPLDLYVIDLGGGLAVSPQPSVKPEDVASAPFSALLSGMLNPDVQPRGPRPVNMRGFLSVMSQSMIGSNMENRARFGERSYAIVSDKYVNFSSRIGYHYAILDAWCGDTINKNYIRFEFAGGAAGNVQRSRRARCIGIILSELGFTVEVSHDRVRARFQKYPRLEILSRLDQLGRLLIMTRQMDMLMVDEEAVRAMAASFLRGEYH